MRASVYVYVDWAKLVIWDHTQRVRGALSSRGGAHLKKTNKKNK